MLIRVEVNCRALNAINLFLLDQGKILDLLHKKNLSLVATKENF